MLFTRFLTPAYLALAAHASDGFYKMDFNLLHGEDLSSALSNFLVDIGKEFPVEDLFGRDSKDLPFAVSVANEQTFYVTNVTIGTPPVSVEVLLDSGSSDLWVMSSINPQCHSHGGDVDCDRYGTFNESASSTWQPNGENFSISYLDKTYARGAWGTDVVSLTPQLKLDNATFAVADDSDSNVGVFGIAYQVQESAQKKYTNIPALMKEQGLINKIAYSLYLGTSSDTSGTILFGGVDRAKYSGELVPIDITKDQNGNPHLLQIPLKSISAHIVNRGVPPPTPTSTATGNVPHIAATTGTPTEGKFVFDFGGFAFAANSTSIPGTPEPSASSSPILNNTVDFGNKPIIVDSGTTLTLLPNATLYELVQNIAPGAVYNENARGYIVPCGLKQKENYIKYDFNGQTTINVPFTDLVLEAGHDATGNLVCAFGIVPNDQPIVGSNFLRSAYAVFDLDDDTISLAQIKYTTSEHIRVIE
ncbi:acid protease [Suhomyces tanzawaensis NRRL Y-17324]|uniref:candidapepsin n=1 Tax=Suhomyces tanzawaensis NRRL Y-17324 TaxID=984487 RepID=A0A1E4SN23_9ASCO|nr:acid protease [Suhomyces tanzawaensis NRRL Y-17324]ODV80920.1 acid protease [Suhomyces tanzawaensis NRRL Y-17324]